MRHLFANEHIVPIFFSIEKRGFDYDDHCSELWWGERGCFLLNFEYKQYGKI